MRLPIFAADTQFKSVRGSAYLLSYAYIYFFSKFVVIAIHIIYVTTLKIGLRVLLESIAMKQPQQEVASHYLAY